MKKIIITTLFCLQTVISLSQNAALIDTVYDKDGRKFPLKDLKINLDGIYGPERPAPSSATCTAGYFNVFFASGSGMSGNTTIEQDRRSIVCQVLRDISGMVNPTLTTISTKVNILVDDISLPPYGVSSPATSGVLGSASAFFALPWAPPNPNPGIADNQIYKTIISGQDAYTNVASSFTTAPNANNYYHGVIVFNFANTMFNFNLNPSLAATSTQIDFYTVVLHEMTHALGFLSLINGNGISKYGAGNNYYSRYDRFLRDKNNAYLLTTNSGCSNQYGLAFTSNTINLAPACPNPTAYTTNSTTCLTANYYSSPNLPKVQVYTPNCFEPTSSLSHFEDMCYPTSNPANNDQYFLMSNAGGFGVTRRFLKEEERLVLCDLGYTTLNTYTSTALGAPNTYTAGNCGGIPVAGINDGVAAGPTYTLNTTVLTPITVSNILSNDINAVSYKCLQTVFGTGNFSNTSGTGSFIYTPVSSGIHLLRYIPVDQFNREGNITYIYINVAIPTGTCNTPVNNPCDLIFNGNFENYNTLPIGYGFGSPSSVCGWLNATGGTPDYFHGFTAAPAFGVPCNINGYEYDNITGNYGYAGFFVVQNSPATLPQATEPLYTKLTSALQPFTAYNLTFDVSLAEGYSNITFPMMAYLSTNTSFTNAGNTGITIGTGIFLQTSTTYTNTNGWMPVNLSFTTGATAGQQYLALGVLTTTLSGVAQTSAPLNNGGCPYSSNSLFNSNQAYYYLDNVKLIPAAYNATLSLPAVVCATQSVNLTPLANPNGGVFSGAGVSCTGTNCAFNVTSTGLGPHYISYSLAAGTGTCPYFANGIITVSNFSVTAALLNTLCLNAGQTATLVATPNATTSTTYTWMPGSLTGATVNVNPTVSTVYTVSASNGGCVITSTVLVPVKGSNPISFTGTPQICSGTYSSIFYLESFLGVGSPPGGLFSGPGIVMQSCPSGICSYISTYPASSFPPGMYTYTYNASILGCNYSKTVSVQVNGFSLTTSQSTMYCSNIGVGAVISATASPSTSVTYTWLPGPLTGASQTVSPSANTTYTVFAGNGQCIYSNTVSVLVNTACCNATNFVSGNTIGLPATSTTISGIYAINQNVTIQGTVWMLGEFRMAPGVSITIPSGSQLFSQRGVHIYACNDMWSGIVVKPGGQFRFGLMDMIEDAVEAVNSTGCTTTSGYDISLSDVVFNRNFKSIVIKNYNQATSTPPFDIRGCVFTSRDFSIAPGSPTWPTASTGSLKSAGSSTTGLASPYNLLNANVANLKAPNASNSSSIGIVLDNVGLNSGSNYYGMVLGDETNDIEFNLFDAQGYGIFMTNSSLTNKNCVFQNTKRLTYITCGTHGCVTNTVAGSAIYDNITTNFNSILDLRCPGTNSANVNFGNRFWNCHAGVEAYNIYRFNAEQAIFRSIQSTASVLPDYLPGNTGIFINTNRFSTNTRYNEFTNITTPINHNIIAGTYDVGAGVQTGIYAAQMVIDNNYFGPQTSTATSQGSNYVSNAITVSSPNSTTWQFANNTGLFIQNNTIDRVYRGVAVGGLASYSCTIKNNKVKVADDIYYGSSQYGINVSNTQNKVVVTTNTLSATGITNTLITLAFFGSNLGTNSPSVTCNALSSSYKAFNFDNANNGTYWRGNTMTTHKQGLTLANSATIGVQGTTGNPQDNQWMGSWTGANYGTFMDFSNAVSSILYVKTGTWTPSNHNGNNSPLNWYSNSGNLLTTTGAFACGTGGGGGGGSMIVAPSTNTNSSSQSANNNTTLSAEEQYVGDNTLYRFFDANPSVKNSSPTYVNFYNSKVNSSIDKFIQVETSLYNHQSTQAQALNNAITITNGVEGNYQSFYNLYIKQQQGNFTSTDSSALINLAKMCPGTDGAVIYQARALYNAIYKTVRTYKENCNHIKANSRLMNIISSNGNEEIKNSWNVDLFPNPNTGNFNLVGKTESEWLDVIITDVTGKIIYKKQVITNNFIANLDLNTSKGVYLVVIKNTNNESITKKLVITD